MITKPRRNNHRIQKRVTNESDKKGAEFSFYAPEAMEVFVAGEFNGWDSRSLPMKRDKSGTWKVKTKLSPGRYEYKFFGDNRWVEELSSGEKVENPFGTQNLVMWVEKMCSEVHNSNQPKEEG